LILQAAGDLAGAEVAARRALEVAEAEPVLPLNRAESLAILAQVLLAQGRTPEALERAEAGLQLLESLGGIDDGEALIRLVHAEALHAAGQGDAARAALGAAAVRLRARAERIGSAALRQSFLERVPENARTLALEKAWAASARLGDA
jgi:hypothetical protein